MNLFKAMSMKMADSFDWNCKKVCKRSKGDTRRIHKQARNKIKQEKGITLIALVVTIIVHKKKVLE